MYSVDVFAVVPLLSGPARRTRALSVHSESPGWGHTGFPSPKHGEIQLALHAALPFALLLHLQPRRVSNLHQRVTSLAGFSAASDERLLMASCPVLSTAFWAAAPCLCSRRNSFSVFSGSSRNGKGRGCWIWEPGMEAWQKWWAVTFTRCLLQKSPRQWSGISRERTTGTHITCIRRNEGCTEYWSTDIEFLYGYITDMQNRYLFTVIK